MPSDAGNVILLIMKNSIYQLALRCKGISDEKMGTDKTLIPYRIRIRLVSVKNP